MAMLFATFSMAELCRTYSYFSSNLSDAVRWSNI